MKNIFLTLTMTLSFLNIFSQDISYDNIKITPNGLINNYQTIMLDDYNQVIVDKTNEWLDCTYYNKYTLSNKSVSINEFKSLVFYYDYKDLKRYCNIEYSLDIYIKDSFVTTVFNIKSIKTMYGKEIFIKDFYNRKGELNDTYKESVLMLENSINKILFSYYTEL